MQRARERQTETDRDRQTEKDKGTGKEMIRSSSIPRGSEREKEIYRQREREEEVERKRQRHRRGSIHVLACPNKSLEPVWMVDVFCCDIGCGHIMWRWQQRWYKHNADVIERKSISPSGAEFRRGKTRIHYLPASLCPTRFTAVDREML